ncbi:DMT family transporter [Geodermatophilus sp. DSM 44513]|uniref:DMT family transporter n=1 Tax=Geodermatophilus sp. DSM 44513 TaxID=1528104 RepID=UPI00141226CA|nr:DMT family transporter [Geodermatophilus sp. DSM 44513]WNV74280.1 DMT family transporter [Geodermatophilus sp. DSM 44513]
MSGESSATVDERRLLLHGQAWGSVGVLAFSLSLPTTQVAVRELGPTFATAGRAVAAAVLAAGYLTWRRARLPDRSLLPSLLLVAAGVVVGFPLFTALALQHTDSAHGAVIVGLLPAATAVAGVLRTGERPSPAFWAACAAGAVAVAVFALVQGRGLPTTDDALTVAAVVCAAVGYAEGARLAPVLGADQVICWALLLSTPVLLPVLLMDVAIQPPAAGASGWACFAYTAAVSMFLGFFAWYRGLALGGVAKVSQVQLAQPLLTVAESVLLFGQELDPTVLPAALAVLACVAAAQRTRVQRQRAARYPEAPFPG